MSIDASYRRLSPQEFDHLRADPKKAASYFENDPDDEKCEAYEAWLVAREADERYLDIQSDWHGLHFLLTGDAEMDGAGNVPPPLGNVVQGGTNTEWEATYGMVRYLTPSEVRAIVDVLESLDEAELRRRYDPAAFRAANIYPSGEVWGESDLEPLLETLAQVRRFFGDAANSGEIVLLSSD